MNISNTINDIFLPAICYFTIKLINISQESGVKIKILSIWTVIRSIPFSGRRKGAHSPSPPRISDWERKSAIAPWKKFSFKKRFIFLIRKTRLIPMSCSKFHLYFIISCNLYSISFQWLFLFIINLLFHFKSWKNNAG